MDKQFRNLKQRQKEKINTWLFEEYRRVWLEIGHEPQPRYNQQILSDVMEKSKRPGSGFQKGKWNGIFTGGRHTIETESTGSRWGKTTP